MMRTLAAASVGFVAFMHILAWCGLLIVHSTSVPMGLYVRHGVDDGALREGAFVCLDATSQLAPAALRDGVFSGRLPKEWRDEPLVKRVEAVGGDTVKKVDGLVAVNGHALANSRARAVDSHGVALPHPTYPTVLKRQQVWLGSEHPEGFDSRYFGAVDVGALTCVAEPLWTL